MWIPETFLRKPKKAASVHDVHIPEISWGEAGGPLQLAPRKD
jgi:hypothetical protein